MSIKEFTEKLKNGELSKETRDRVMIAAGILNEDGSIAEAYRVEAGTTSISHAHIPIVSGKIHYKKAKYEEWTLELSAYIPQFGDWEGFQKKSNITSHVLVQMNCNNNSTFQAFKYHKFIKWLNELDTDNLGKECPYDKKGLSEFLRWTWEDIDRTRWDDYEDCKIKGTEDELYDEVSGWIISQMILLGEFDIFIFCPKDSELCEVSVPYWENPHGETKWEATFPIKDVRTLFSTFKKNCVELLDRKNSQIKEPSWMCVPNSGKYEESENE